MKLDAISEPPVEVVVDRDQSGNRQSLVRALARALVSADRKRRESSRKERGEQR